MMYEYFDNLYYLFNMRAQKEYLSTDFKTLKNSTYILFWSR